MGTDAALSEPAPEGARRPAHRDASGPARNAHATVGEGEAGRHATLLTLDEASVALNVPRTWLRDKVTSRQVPHTRLGRHVRFTTAHLQQIIAAGEQPVVTLAPGARRGRRRLLS